MTEVRERRTLSREDVQSIAARPNGLHMLMVSMMSTAKHLRDDHGIEPYPAMKTNEHVKRNLLTHWQTHKLADRLPPRPPNPRSAEAP